MGGAGGGAEDVKNQTVQNKLINLKFLSLVPQTNPATLEVAQKMCVNKRWDEETEAESWILAECGFKDVWSSCLMGVFLNTAVN